MKINTTNDFAFYCASRTTGIIRISAAQSFITGKSDVFVAEMIEQDSDEGSRSGTKRALGPTLYQALQKFK
ncbi:MAG: hypothetical protein ACRCYO_13425 [Bacteroidia bacterium]